MKFYAKLVIVALLTGMVALSGCGSSDDDSPKVHTESTTVAADQVIISPSGNATVAAGETVVAETKSGVPALTIPSGVTIDADVALTAPPTINVSTPSNGTTFGDTVVKINGTTYTVTDSAGAVDISLSGVSSFMLNSPGATVVIPVVKTPAAVGANATPVLYIKSDGTSGTLFGTYAATTGTTGPGTVTVTGVTNFCKFVAEPELTPSATGSTGGTSGKGI